MFEHTKEKEAIKLVQRGERPVVDESLRNSTDPVHQILLKVMEATMKQNPKDRITARQAQHMFQEVLQKLDPHWKLTDPFMA